MHMKLFNFLVNKPHGFKAQFAEQLGISRSFLRQIEVGKAKVPPYLAKRIEQLTQGEVTKSELRPDLLD